MFDRQIIPWVFWCMLLVNAQYIPISSIGDDNDCALYLSGPGRTSAFDYNLNLLRGSFPYDGQHTCITYEAVNQAYIDARKRINVATPKGDWKTEDIASVGELVLDISISLARTYGLTYEDIEKGLPLIDTSKTLIREVCPPFLAHVECRAGKYRRFDGLCTNLQNPTWGATMTPFQRLLAPLYADGINAPRVSVTGRDLPLSRIVSRTMHPDDGFHDHAGTVMVIAWGQFMDHDYTLTGTPLDPFNRNDPEECCNRPPHQKHPYCNELRIPDDDYFYRLFNIKCIDFVRGFPSPRVGCRLGSRNQFNTLTGVLDGNTVYGVTEKFSRKLRSGYGGLLRMNPVFEEYGLKDLLPLKLDIPDEGCTRPNRSMYCFEAGEIRVNEQLVLTCMHTLMAREHNRVARGLAHVNPHWDDETLFQEARRIVIAEIQHITYNEFLPILLGKEVMEKFGLLLQKDGYWDGHDEHINPNVIDAFAAAAFRFGHSLLPTAIERWSKAHKFIASKRLSDLIRRPYDLYRAGIFDEYLMGLMNQVAQAMDDSITQEVTNHLFKKPGARFGMDLVSFNMQRGREFGLPGYMEFRKFCGLPGAGSFQELFGSMPNETIQKYESIFEHPSDVDLWSGGVSERPLPGSMLGPTFACIIATQFSYSRRGDRFWYELPNQPSSFTPEQLAELKKARLSRIICDNTDIIDTVQVYPMVLPDHEINPRVPCRSGVIPSIDFSKWADFNGHHSVPTNPYDFETKADIKATTDKTKNDTVIEKTMGHYKNSLRRRRRNVENSTTTPSPASNDSQTAAIIVTQVTGSHPNNDGAITVTERAVPLDQSEDTSPQTFTQKVENPNANQNYYTFDDEEEQVSQRDGDDEINADKEPTVYYNDKFIADEKLPLYESDENQAEEIEQSNNDSTEPVEHSQQENTDNEEFVREQNLGYTDFVDESDSGVLSSSTESDDNSDESRVNKCTRTGTADFSGNRHERDEASVGRGCADDSESLDGLNNNSDKQKPLNNDNESRTNGNLKEQFEHIPLDYKHDDAQDENKANLKSEEHEFPFKIDLGDTTVEIENITLPESIFGFYRSDFVDNHRAEDAKNAKLQNKDSAEDSNENDDEGSEEEKDEEPADYDFDAPYALKDEEEIIPGYVAFDDKPKKIEDYSEDKNSEYLHDYIGDPNLRGAVTSLLEKSKKTEDEAGSDDDPKYSYSWTLEYGQPA